MLVSLHNIQHVVKYRNIDSRHIYFFNLFSQNELAYINGSHTVQEFSTDLFVPFLMYFNFTEFLNK
jgi:hypothetical protein